MALLGVVTIMSGWPNRSGLLGEKVQDDGGEEKVRDSDFWLSTDTSLGRWMKVTSLEQ